MPTTPKYTCCQRRSGETVDGPAMLHLVAFAQTFDDERGIPADVRSPIECPCESAAKHRVCIHDRIVFLCNDCLEAVAGQCQGAAASG
jgi:hypothetical protein